MCHNPDEVIEAIGYNSEQDLDNPADSVFCSHGAGFVVKWGPGARAHASGGVRLERAGTDAGVCRSYSTGGGVFRRFGAGQRTANHL